MSKYFVFIALISLMVACTGTRESRSDVQLRAKAMAILAQTPVIDTHIDFPMTLSERNEWFQPGYTALALRHSGGQFDYDRATAGGLYGAFMSIYIPASYQKLPGKGKSLADSLIKTVTDIANAHPARFALALQADDVTRNFAKQIVSLPMGMENGAPVETIADVEAFYKKGIRYITLAHSRDNQICDSSYDTLNTNGGLSPFGEQVVREMNRVGIIVDVSHLTDASIVDILRISTRPVAATHSGCRHFTPGFARNLPDSLIISIAKKGGVVQVPVSHYFLTSASREEFKAAEKAMTAAGITDPNTPEARKFMKKALSKKGMATVKTVADQIDHIRSIAGIDHVGIGSDFDGVGLAVPPDLSDVSMYPNLIMELLKRGYTDKEIRKVCSANFLRVWKANE